MGESKQAVQLRHLRVSDGRDPVGTIDLVDGGYVVADSARKVIGRFTLLRDALDALSKHRRSK